MPVHDIFSNRGKALPDTFQYDVLPNILRGQIAWIVKTPFAALLKHRSFPNPYKTVSEVVCEEHGLISLGERRELQDNFWECWHTSSQIGLVLDMIEVSFKVICRGGNFHDSYNKDEAKECVDTLNYRFRQNGIGYEFDYQSKRLVRMDNVLLHQAVVRPALCLLADQRYATANEEFLKAHEHYRKAEYDDCLTDCCRAFESTLKIICHKKMAKDPNWSYNTKDTANTLLQVCFKNNLVPSHLQDMLLTVPRMRNNLSGHGQGVVPQTVDEHLAKFALYATASAITLLVEASNY